MKYRVIFFAGALILLFACDSGEKSSPSQKAVERADTRIQKPKRDFHELLGKDLSAEFGAVVPKRDVGKGPVALLIYVGSDCYSCLRSGFYLAKKIDSLSGRQRVFVLGIMANQGREQEAFGYKEYIYSDPDDTIRKKLRYVPTPVLMGLDSCGRVKAVLPVRDTSGADVDSFLKLF